MPIRFYLQVGLATLLWGTAFPLVKKGLDYAPSTLFAGLRITLAGLLLLAMSAAISVGKQIGTPIPPEEPEKNNSKSPTAVKWGWVLLIGFLSSCCLYGLFFWGMSRVSATSGAIADGANPILASLMAHFLLHDDKLTRRKLWALGLAFAGLCVIALVRHPSASGVPTSPIGLLIMLIGFILGNAGTILVIKYRGRLTLMQLSGGQMFLGGFMLLAISMIIDRNADWTRIADRYFLFSLIWLASVTAIAFRIWYALVRTYKMTSVAVYSFLISVWGTMLSVVFLGERFIWPLAAGLVLVVCGIILMNTERGSHIRELPPESTP